MKKKTIRHGLFFAILWTTWSWKENFHNLKCLSSLKYIWHITCLEVMRLPSWPENVKFIVKMQFFAFLTPWEICLNQLQIWNLDFLEVFIFPQNQYFYLHFWTFKGTLKMLQITILPSNSAGKILKMAIKSDPHGLWSWNLWDFLFSIRLSNGEYFKDFKIFDLTWIWWISLEWPFSLLLCVMTCLFFIINTMQKTLKPSKKCFNAQDGWGKTSCSGISAEGYWQKHEMQVISKKVYWKSNRVFQTFVPYCHWKRFLSELNRCIFQISVEYIKLVIPKILIILVLCSLIFTLKLRDLPPPNKTPPHTKIKISDPPPAKSSEMAWLERSC